MSADIVFQRVMITNHARLAQYSQEVGDTFKETPVDFLVAYGKQETLEGVKNISRCPPASIPKPTSVFELKWIT